MLHGQYLEPNTKQGHWSSKNRLDRVGSKTKALHLQNNEALSHPKALGRVQHGTNIHATPNKPCFAQEVLALKHTTTIILLLSSFPKGGFTFSQIE